MCLYYLLRIFPCPFPLFSFLPTKCYECTSHGNHLRGCTASSALQIHYYARICLFLLSLFLFGSPKGITWDAIIKPDLGMPGLLLNSWPNTFLHSWFWIKKQKDTNEEKKTETRQTCFYHWAKSLLNSVYFNWHFCTFKKHSTNHLLLGSMELQTEASCCLTDTDWANYISFWSNHHDLFVSLVTTQFQWRFFYYVMHHIWENVIICLFLPNVMYISCDMLQCAANENTYLVPLNRQILTHLQKTNSHRSNELSETMRWDTNY